MRSSPLRDVHEAGGARFTDFGGWEMPVDFDSIREEHRAVRESAGRFDVSHMGEVVVAGADARLLVDRLTTNDVGTLDPGDAQYAAMTDEEGIILDDTVVYRPPAEGPTGGPVADADYLVVPNAGHDAETAARFREHGDRLDLEVTVENATEALALLAVQGPEAVDLVADRSQGGDRIAGLSRFETCYATVGRHPALVSRTGYTGEDGVELLCAWNVATELWTAIDCPPCGLGARDTLRTEMGFLLSGQEFDPEDTPRNPYEAGIGFAVALETEFVGRDALAAVADAGVDRRLVGVRLEERGVPRNGYELRVDGESAGELTSGTVSPTLEEPIGLGYLPVEHADEGTRVEVLIRGEEKRGTVTTPPFLEEY